MIRNAAIVGAVVSEALAVYVLAEWFAAGYQEDRNAIGWWALVLVAVVAFFLPRLTDWLALSRPASYAILGGAAYVVIYGALRIAYAGDFALWDLSWIADFVSDSETAAGKGAHAGVAGALLIAVWARESTRSASDMDLEALPRTLGPAFAVVTVVAIFGALTERPGEVGRAAAAFYAVAVITLAFAQLSLSGVTIGDLRAGGVTATLLGGTVAVAVVGVVVVAVLLGVVGPIIGPPLGAVVGAVLTVILTPPAWLLEHFFRFLLGDEPLEIPVREITRTSRGEDEAEEEDPSQFVEILGGLFRSALILAVILVAIGIVIYFTRLRRRVRAQEEVGPVRASAGGIGEDLASLWRSLRPGGRARHASGATGAARLYREVLDRAERMGHPREPAETPREFAPELNQALHTPVTDEITAAYEQARYAGREPDATTLEALERRWREST